MFDVSCGLQWCYAFSIVPQGPAPVPLPANVTPSPFSAAAGNRGVKRGANVDDTNENGVPNFIFQQGGGGERGGKRGRTGAGGPPPEHYTCNICGDKGHWIHDCPEKESRSRNKRTAPPIKRAYTGGFRSINANADAVLIPLSSQLTTAGSASPTPT